MKNNLPTSLDKRTVAMFADGQNVNVAKYSKAILHFVESLGEASISYVYHHWRTIQDKIEQKLQSDNWQCVDILKGKNELDNRLMDDARRFCSGFKPDVLVLITGDKDFAPLVKSGLESGQRVIIIGRRNHVSYRLQKLVPNDVFFIEDLAIDFNRQLAR